MKIKARLAICLTAFIALGGLAYINLNLLFNLNTINSQLTELDMTNENLQEQIVNIYTNKSDLQIQLEQLEFENIEMHSFIQQLEEENKELKKLYADMQTNSSNMLALNQEDKNLIAQLIYSEARGESKEGKQAVANVVFNRIKDSRFPDTVHEAIHQPRQFVEAAILHTYPVLDSALEAIESAIEADITQGAFFFWAPSIATCRWLESRTVTTIIGGHHFLK